LQVYLKQAYAAGQKTVALTAFQTYREQLLKTFEIDVSEETRELIEAIENDSLKIEKLSSPASKTQVKRSPQALLGRQAELTELSASLKQPECRTLCITGPGGVGKTRLAQELAQQLLADYEHGVYFAPLASINKPEEIINAVASALSFLLGHPYEKAYP
jgi:DNA replication protein DnaC